MKRRGLKNPDVARELGVHVVTVSKWRTDRQLPDDSMLQKLASLFRVTPAWLRYGVGQMAEAPDAPVRVSHLVSTGRQTEDAFGYALSDDDIARVPGLADAILRMPDHVHAVAWPFLGEMARAGVSKEARDRAEAFLTHLACGVLAPGYPSRGATEDVADAQDAILFLRRIYERRGIALALPAIDVSVAPDPDAISGAEMERRLVAKQRKPKAG